MRTNTLFALFVIGLPLVAVAQTPDHNFEELICKEAEAHAKLIEFRDPPPPDDGTFDLKYYRFNWRIDPAVYEIIGTATPYFEVKQANLSAMAFTLATSLAVDAVSYHGENIPFTQSGDFGLTINLPAPLPLGQLDSLSIFYHGSPPSGGFGSFIKSVHGGTPIIWTLSEPFGAQDWWPCKNGLTDKIDSIDVFVSSPIAYRAASNGVLVQENEQGNNRICHWKHRYPIAPYLVAIAVTDYAPYTDIVPLSNGEQLLMLNYPYPESVANAQAGTAKMVPVMQFYDSLFVTYPFHKEKYGHAEFGWGGGMEHQTMSFVISYDWGLLAHEMGHQWFGDMVTCGSWEDIWLNEGFATFLEGLTRERFNQTNAWYNWRAGKINNITSVPDGSVRVDDTTSVGRIFSGRLSYNKGAYLLHMLRWKLGEGFFQGVRDYLNDRQYSYARTPSLKSHLEQASGTDLTEFFNDWYYGQGFPAYTVSWQQIGDQCYIKLDQTTSHPSVDFFEMPVPIQLIGSDNQTKMLRLDHEVNGQTFQTTVDFTVSSVAFDPDLWLLAKDTVINAQLVAVDPVLDLASLRVYPNPATQILQVNVDDKTSNQLIVWEIYNAVGQKMQSGQAQQTQFNLPVASLGSGMYRLQCRGENGVLQAVSFVKNAE